jgi:hypothetical protein
METLSLIKENLRQKGGNSWDVSALALIFEAFFPQAPQGAKERKKAARIILQLRRAAARLKAKEITIFNSWDCDLNGRLAAEVFSSARITALAREARKARDKRLAREKRAKEVAAQKMENIGRKIESFVGAKLFSDWSQLGHIEVKKLSAIVKNAKSIFAAIAKHRGIEAVRSLGRLNARATKAYAGLTDSERAENGLIYKIKSAALRKLIKMVECRYWGGVIYFYDGKKQIASFHDYKDEFCGNLFKIPTKWIGIKNAHEQRGDILLDEHKIEDCHFLFMLAAFGSREEFSRFLRFYEIRHDLSRVRGACAVI